MLRILFLLLSACLQLSWACQACGGNQLSSTGGFGKDYPRFLGNWMYSGEWDGNPFYFCYDCQGLRAYVLFLRVSGNSNSGQWAITDCHPDDSACGGGAHKLLISPTTNSVDTCIQDLPNEGWSYCCGELTTGGICSQYCTDDTINFTCM